MAKSTARCAVSDPSVPTAIVSSIFSSWKAATGDLASLPRTCGAVEPNRSAPLWEGVLRRRGCAPSVDDRAPLPRPGSTRGAAMRVSTAVQAVIFLAALVAGMYAVVKVADGWASWVVFGVIV